MPLPSLTTAERTNLAMDLLEYCNMFPNLWENKNPWIIGHILHKITDPRETEVFRIHRGTRTLAAIKKNPALWARIKPFVACNSWNQACKCKHGKSSHNGIGTACTARKGRYDRNSPMCRCNRYEERGL